jgi:formate dehydrogenase subunit gamma
MAKTIERYSADDRVNHWVVALSFILLMLSGLAFFHPSMYWLTNLFGGGTWARIAHPFIGVVMAGAFAMLAWRVWEHNHITDADRVWLDNVDKVLAGHEEFSQDIGRYNGGQKRLFQLMVACVVLLAVSGFVMWRPYFAPMFQINIVRLATLAHAASAAVLIGGFIVHVYATIWVKGTIGAMMGGRVSAAWAKKHHPGWYREITGNSK